MTDQLIMEGSLDVSVVDKNGVVLTKKHGFFVEEEAKGAKHFDFYPHPEMGSLLLLGTQVFCLGFWKKDQLLQLRDLIDLAIMEELGRRDENAR